MGVLKDVSYALNPHPGRRPQPVGYVKTLHIIAELTPLAAKVVI